MSLYQAPVSQAALRSAGGDVDRLLRGIGYAGLLQWAARAAGDTEAVVTVTGLRGFQQRHPAGPVVAQALNRGRWPQAVVADAGGPDAAARWARPGLTPASRLVLDRAAVADKEAAAATAGPGQARVAVTLLVPAPTAADLAPGLAAAGLLPVGAFGAANGLVAAQTGAPAADVPLPPVIGTGTAKRARASSSSSSSSSVAKRQDKTDSDELDEDDDFTGPNMAATAEPKDGDDLEAMADADDAESIGTYEVDGKFLVAGDGDGPDGEFVAGADSDSDSDSDSGSDSGSSSSGSSSSSSSSNDEPEDSGAGTRATEAIDVVAAAAAALAGPSALARANPVPVFDGHVQLYEDERIRLADGTVMQADHTYVVDGQVGYTSTTTLVAQWMKPFDDKAVSRGMVARHTWAQNREYRGPAEAWAGPETARRWQQAGLAADTLAWPAELQTAARMFVSGAVSWPALHAMLTDPGLAGAAPTQPQIGQVAERLGRGHADACAQHIRAMWLSWRQLGTDMHERIEHFYEGLVSRQALEARNEPELRQFLLWHDDWLTARGYEPFRMELRVVDDATKCTGSIDALFRHRHTGQLIMVDWKRSKGVARTSYGGDVCWGPLDGMVDCKHVKYEMQQNMYRDMLHRHTSLRLSAMYLVVCHPRQGEHYQVIDMDLHEDRVQGLRAQRLQDLETAAGP